jgi:hypothetical protein
MMLDTAAAAGISERAFWEMLPREFARRVEAERKRREAKHRDDWDRALFLANHMRGFMDMEPLGYEELFSEGEGDASAPSASEWDALTDELDELREQKGIS